ncbi:hypothetical protein JCM5353_005188 [Sporobolomyces roseus]
MQFPKAPRFVSPPESLVPGPGAYDPHSPPGHEKLGVLGVAKAERFAKEATNIQSTFGMYAEGGKENVGPRKRIASGTQSGGAGIDRERHKQQLEELKVRMTGIHEKEVAKLVSKINKLETSREESVKEKNESGKEMVGLKSEIRHLSSKLTKTESLLSKHQTSLPLLQSKLTTLQTSHEQSRLRKDAELQALRDQMEEISSLYQGKIEECREWEETARREREGRKQAGEVARSVIEELREELREVRVEDLQRERLSVVKLERQVQDRTAQVEALVDYSQGLEHSVKRLEEQVSLLEGDGQRMREMWRIDRGLLVEERNEKEWRQRARSDQRELVGLVEELELAREEAEAVKAVGKNGESVWKLRKREWRDDKETMKTELENTEKELNSAVNEEIPRLESLLNSANSSIETINSQLSDQASHISSLESDLSNLVQESTESAERYEGEIEEQKRVAQTISTELEKEKVDKRRVVGILVQCRAAETALREQVEDLSSQLRLLAPLSAEHTSLHQTIDHLARINAATEVDLQELVDQNAELAGHSNQNQKIVYVSSVREQLIESKRKHLSTLSLLTSAQSRLKELESELDSYRAVPTSSSSALPSSLASSSAPPASVRSRVSRPNIEDIQAPTPFQLLQQQSQRSALPHSQSTNSIPTIVTSSSSLPAIPRASGRPSTFRASTTPSSTSTLSTLIEDESLLPPILAKSASSFLLRPPQAVGLGGSGGGLVVRDARRRRSEVSNAERMEGRMSVSELFN